MPTTSQEHRRNGSRRIFISHASEDTSVARDIAERLRSRGLEPWLDVESLKAGDDWRTAIEEALEKANVALVLISSRAASSPWVSAEWSALRERTWERPDLKVMPVLLKNSQLPPFLREWQSAALRTSAVDEIARRVAQMAWRDESAAPVRHGPSASELKEVGERFQALRQVIRQERAGEGVSRADESEA